MGTVTEIYDYLRLLYARIGIPHCPECGERVSGQTLQINCRYSNGNARRKRVLCLLAPFIKDQKGEHKLIFEQVKKSGYARVRVDGTIMDIAEAQGLNLDKQKSTALMSSSIELL